jgi:hypothetical protein
MELKHFILGFNFIRYLDYLGNYSIELIFKNRLSYNRISVKGKHDYIININFKSSISILRMMDVNTLNRLREISLLCWDTFADIEKYEEFELPRLRR